MKKIYTFFLLATAYCTPLSAHLTVPSSETQARVLPAAIGTRLRLSYSNGAAGVNGFYGFALGYGRGRSVISDSAQKGGGGVLKAELGVKIAMRSQSTNGDAQMSVSVAVMGYPVAKNSFGFVSLPISYTRLSYGSGGEESGFYWQAGLNLNYMIQADDTKKLNTSVLFNRVIADPAVGCGLFLPFRIINHRDGANMGSGRAMVGLISSFNAMDIRKGTDTQRGFTIAVQWHYLFF